MKESAIKGPATNRQKKILRLFGIEFLPEISKGEVGLEIRHLFADKNKKIRWEKYKHLTGDYGQETDQLRDFDPKELDAHELPPPPPPPPRTRSKNFDDDEMPDYLKPDVLYNNPPPKIKFAASVFVFTGKFSFGEKKDCRQAVIEKGGKVEGVVKTSSDYLIVGEKGNPAWKRGNYGGKIAKAFNFRHNYGKPAIVSESDWKAALGGGNETPKV